MFIRNSKELRVYADRHPATLLNKLVCTLILIIFIQVPMSTEMSTKYSLVNMVNNDWLYIASKLITN